MTSEPLIILLAEDDDGHAELTSMNLERVGVINTLVRVRDGQEALDFIRCQGPFAARLPNGPLVVLLDINMPRLDGVETLRQLKAEERTAQIPVIMLTTTDDPREVQRCYQLGCSVYITKPVEYDAFANALRELGLFLQFVKVPPERGA